jgi:hypothetical protein
LVFALGRAQEAAQPSQISLDEVGAAMKDLPLLEREMLWLMIQGYDGLQIAAIMMHAAATAEAVEQIAKQRLTELFPAGHAGARAVCAQGLIESAEKAKTEQCTSLKTFNNLVNGQISWREREQAEEHMTNCFYCMDRFTSFQEMVRLRKDVAALPEPEVDAILARLPFVSAKRSGVLSRLFAGR